MENSLENGKCSKDSIKELGTSQSSIKSTKSLDKSNTSGSFKNEKIHFKEENHQDIDNQKVNTDASLKVPHKFITNWRQACDRTKDKTKDLLKRWRTLPEIETDVGKRSDTLSEKDDSHIESCGWSVHVWSKYIFPRIHLHIDLLSFGLTICGQQVLVSKSPIGSI